MRQTSGLSPKPGSALGGVRGWCWNPLSASAVFVQGPYSAGGKPGAWRRVVVGTGTGQWGPQDGLFLGRSLGFGPAPGGCRGLSLLSGIPISAAGV